MYETPKFGGQLQNNITIALDKHQILLYARYMTITKAAAIRFTPATFPVGVTFIAPCGCPGCDKWTDCDWCDLCNPNFEAFLAGVREENDWDEVADKDNPHLSLWQVMYPE